MVFLMWIGVLGIVACVDVTGDTGVAGEPVLEETGPADSGTGSVERDSGGETGAAPESPCHTDGLTGGFVTREGDRLMLEGEPFRFVSFNVPNLHVLEDPDWHLPTPWEQADAMCSIQQLGGRVARTYVLSVGSSDSELPRHVTGPGEFSEELFVALDQALAQAARHDVRLIIPLVDQWWWWGGIADYAGFRGQEEAAFWTDEQVIADFEETIRYVVGRVNTVTGVPYVDDPALLAWETGNELAAPTAWTARITALLKDLDPNHLVVDGHYGIAPESLDDPNVDIVSDHFYWPPPYWDDYAAAAAAGQATAEGSRPFLIGEYGFVETPRVAELLDTVIEGGITGALIWSLRHHRDQGGFYWHTEIEEGETLFRSYHWPGFGSGEAYDEREILALHREAAWAVAGEPAPELQAPVPPTVLSCADPGAVMWQGSTGASHYTLYRASSEKGPWTEVLTDFDDASEPNTARVADPEPPLGETVFYRMEAHGEGGSSKPSEPCGPVETSTERVWTDSLEDLGGADDHANLGPDSSNAGLFGGDTGRLTRVERGDGWISWSVEGEVVAAEVVVYHWPWEVRTNVVLEGSSDGVDWHPLSTTSADEGGDWARELLTTDGIPGGTTGVRVRILDHDGEVWNPQLSEVSLRWQ